MICFRCGFEIRGQVFKLRAHYLCRRCWLRLRSKDAEKKQLPLWPGLFDK